MADKVYPAAKPNPNPPQSAATGGAAGTQPSFPPTKSQLYNRPMYRPKPQAKSRGCCRVCCCWLIFILISLFLLAALSAGIFYVLYRPQRPHFSVSSIQLTTLNLNLAVTARNPNKKIAFLYDPISVSVSSDGVDIGDGSFPGFVHGKKNTTVMRTTVKSSQRSVDPSVAVVFKKSAIDLDIDLETKAGVKVGGLKTKRMAIRVYCEGIRIDVPKGKKIPLPSTPDVSCKVRLRVKIWKWTF